MAHDEWSEHVRNGEGFSGEDFIIAAPGLLPHLQFFNPVASGKRARLRFAEELFVAFTRPVAILRHDVPLAVLGPPAGFIIENLLGSGGPAPVVELRRANLAVLTGSSFGQLNSRPNNSSPYPAPGLEWGHDLLEGQGIVLAIGLAQQTLIVNWQWVEVPL